jgi:hypothetical protein
MSEDAQKLEEAKNQENQEKLERSNAFLAEYGELVKKHNVDFASYPVFVPDGAGAFKVVIQSTPVDISGNPKASPFVAS